MSDTFEQLDPFDHHRGCQPLLRPTRLRRKVVFVAINLAAYAVVNAFWGYLASGKWWDFSAEAFRRSLSAPFDVLLHPLSVVSHPWMILVFGLLLGVNVLAPIIVAVLYRLRLAVVFLLMLAVVAKAPVLAGAAGLGCILATRTTMRSNLPMLAAMFGLAPVVVCVALLDVLGVLFTVDVAAEPLRMWLRYMPFMVAGATAVVGFSAVLMLAQLTRFRPGVMWPVLTILLAAPLAAFYGRVGPAELQYALIVRADPSRPLTGGDTLWPEEALADFRRDPRAAGLAGVALEARIDEDLRVRRDRLMRACREFLAIYGDSRRASSVAWIEAQCASLQLDEAAFEAGLVRYTASFVKPESQPNWQGIVDRYGESDHAALAQLKLAELALRDKRVDAADDHLAVAHEGLQRLLPAYADLSRPRTSTSLFARDPSLPSHGYYVAAMHQIRRLTWLMHTNDIFFNTRAAEAFAAGMQVDPRSPSARPRYRALAAQYADTPVADDLRVAAAIALRDSYARAEELIPLAEARAMGDAAIRANYELGQLVARTEALRLDENVHEPNVYFRRVVEAPENPWQQRAEVWLAGQLQDEAPSR
jgi:hypothetical protein